MSNSPYNFGSRVRETIANLDDNLIGYAARAALSELQDNWEAALVDGAKPTALITDIDLVINQLKQVRKTLTLPAD